MSLTLSQNGDASRGRPSRMCRFAALDEGAPVGRPDRPPLGQGSAGWNWQREAVWPQGCSPVRGAGLER